MDGCKVIWWEYDKDNLEQFTRKKIISTQFKGIDQVLISPDSDKFVVYGIIREMGKQKNTKRIQVYSMASKKLISSHDVTSRI